jgi:hypothetical protein
MNKLERINKYLSEMGVCSRREVDELIETGRVEINGQPAHIGMQIDTEHDKVYVDGQLVKPTLAGGNAIGGTETVEKVQPWWIEHNEQKKAKQEALMQNPKSKLLRKGPKKAAKSTSVKNASAKSTTAKSTTAKSASAKSTSPKSTSPKSTTAKNASSAPSMKKLKQAVTQASAIKTRGHSAADKQAKTAAVKDAQKALASKEARRDELRRAKTFTDVYSNLANPARTLKERRVEGVNPKAAQLRGKKARPATGKRTRRK